MILLKKTIRSMFRHKKAYISCILLMAVGVWTYTTMNTALNEIENGKNNYYSENRLGDAFATVTQIPENSLRELEEIEGIKQVDGRLIQTLRVIMEDNVEDVLRLRVISTKIGMNDHRLNSYVQTGNDIQSINDILVGFDFYNAYGFKPGDKISLLVNQQIHDFDIQGYIYSPEYIYIVENPTELFSDTTKYNVAYVDESMLMSLLDLDGIYNDLSFALEDGYTYDDVKDELEYELDKYGLISLYEKEDLFSYLMLEEEISGGRSMSTTIPMTFVGMAAIVLYLMLNRVIEQDRTQIGTLKAFGYSNNRVLIHYISHGFITGLLGALVGLSISIMTISPYIQFYLDYYKMPIGTNVTDYKYYYIGGLWSIIGGIIGAYYGAKNVVKLKPAEAMRPKAPPPVRKDITHYLPFLKYIFNSRGFMTVRNISRNKIRSGFIVIGITFSYSMMVMIGMMSGLIDNMFFNQFTNVLKYDAEIVISDTVDYNQGVQSAMAIDEIDYAEGILKLPINIYNNHKQSATILVGIKEDNYLYKVYDDDRKINLQLPKDGIILGSILADSLDVKKGDYIFISGPYFDKDQKLYISDVAVQNLGSSAYIDLEFISDLMNQNTKINSLIFDSKGTSSIRQQLVTSETLVKVEDKAKTLELYQELLGSFNFIIWILQGLAIVIGFTIIYNTSVISLSERSREYATLRVLGLTINEVKEIMSLEYWLLCFIGIVIGVPFARFLNTSLINSIDVDTFSWPAAIPGYAYIIGAIGCCLAVAFSNMTSVKAIKKLDLVEVLKERE